MKIERNFRYCFPQYSVVSRLTRMKLAQLPREYSVISRLTEALQLLGWSDFLTTDPNSDQVIPFFKKIILGGHSQV